MKRQHLIFKISAILLMCAGIVSCDIDELMEMPDNIHAEDGNMLLSFISDPMDAFRVGTKSSDAKNDAEKQINQLYIFFFGNDGEYLKGGYLSGYENAPDDGGFYAPGEGVSMLKIDNTKFTDPQLADGATIFALANIMAHLDENGNEVNIFADSDNDGRPDMFPDQATLESFFYKPASGISIGLPEYNGKPMMPMAGKMILNLAGNNITPEADRIIELKALMSRVDINISLASDISNGNYPSLTLVEWSALNLPTSVPLTAPESTTDNSASVDILNTNQKTIYNNSGTISLSFYMFENIQANKEKIDWEPYYDDELGFTAADIDEETGYPHDVYDVDKDIDYRQRYKPLIAENQDASTAVELHAFYSTYNEDGSGNSTYDVRYTIYLGANHINDFKIKRNHQYKNDITIKGITRVGNNPNHITFDARVNITEGNSEYYISILRERNHDAHFCVTPMDVYLFSENNPTMDVILGTMPEGSSDPADATDVPDWIRMERIPADYMENGTVPDGLAKTNYKTGMAWCAGNGKRNYFTTDLMNVLPDYETIRKSRDRIYFYIDENLTLEDRNATVTFIYKENGQEVKRREMLLEQVHLLPVTYVEDQDGGDGREHTIYMEQFEEYLDHYDPLDEHRTEQIYDGLPWANGGTLANSDIGTLRDINDNEYNASYNNYYDGWEYTSYVVTERSENAIMKLNDIPISAFHYCHNKNKRNQNGEVPAQYELVERSWPWDDYYKETGENKSKWFLPAITQMEKALEEFRPRYPEFADYYWSSSAAKEDYLVVQEREDGDRARATRIQSDGTHISSDQQSSSMYPNGGNAPRTQSLRIRAFRIDLNPASY